MKNYKVQFVNLETGYTTIQAYPSIKEALDALSELMFTASHKYRITITKKSN